MAKEKKSGSVRLVDIISDSVQSPKEKIAKRFRLNVDRVEKLRAIAADQSADHEGDILRSAVVLLHATIEDVLRGVEGIYLRAERVGTGVIDDISLTYVGKRPAAKIDLEVLKHIGGANISEIVNKCVTQHLNTQTYNDKSSVLRIAALFRRPSEEMKTLARTVDQMMKRRHHIVHQSDRDGVTVDSHGKPRPITGDDVKDWTEAVTLLATLILRSVPESVSAAERARQLAARDEIITAQRDWIESSARE